MSRRLSVINNVRRRHWSMSVKLHQKSISSLPSFAHLNDLEIQELSLELRLRGREVSEYDSATDLRDKLREEVPDSIPGVWPREIRLISHDLNMFMNQNLPNQFYSKKLLKNEKLLENFKNSSKPILLNNIPLPEWPAFSEWSPSKNFFNRFKNEKLEIRNGYEVGVHGGIEKKTNNDKKLLLELPHELNTNSNVLCFSTKREKLYSAIRQDIHLVEDEVEVEETGIIDNLKALREYSMQPVLSVGGANGGLPFHRHGDSWLRLLHGRKLWCFLPPNQTPSDVLQRTSISRLINTNLNKELMICIQKKGEILYIPRGWWHATYNISSGGGEKDNESDNDETTLVGLGSGGGGVGSTELEDRIAIGFGGLGESPGLHWFIAEGKGLENAYENTLRKATLALKKDSDNDDEVEAVDRVGKEALEQETSHGHSLMHTACDHNRLEDAQWLASKVITTTTTTTSSSSKVGGRHKEDKSVKSLVNKQDRLGRTPLHYAALNGSCELVKWLLDQGASPRIKSSLGDSPVDFAKRNKRLDVLTLLSSVECL